MYIHIYIMPHPQSGDSLCQETFLAPPADKQSRNYDIDFSNHHLSLFLCLSLYIYIYMRERERAIIYYIYTYTYTYIYI